MNRTYASCIETLLVNQLDLYYKVCKILKSDFIPNKIDDEFISCHQVCERLIKRYDLKRQLRHAKGKFNSMDHSWLVMESRIQYVPDLIIDVYPWCSVTVNPLLLVKCYATNMLYVEDDKKDE